METIEWATLTCQIVTKTFAVWLEGSSTVRAQHLGDYDAYFFGESIDKALADAKLDSKFFNRVRVSFLGSAFHDDEARARRTFG